MRELSLQDYVPLGLSFHIDKNISPPCVIGSVSSNVSIFIGENGNVLCGDEALPGEPVRFVNTTLRAFGEFIDAHAEYTNEAIYRCQMDGREDFQSHFVRGIRSLVVKFLAIDPEAIADRNNWWPFTVDSKLAEYRRYG